MAVNNDGHVLDSSGNVAVAFEWGNLPMQPNDDRADGTPTITETVGGDQNVGWTQYSKINSARLNFTLGNHSIIESGWNGFPAYTPNDPGEQISSTPYAVVPNVVGLTLAAATDALKDAGLVLGTVATANNAAGATALNDGKIKLQATAAGANSIALGTAVNLTKYVYTA